MGIIAFGIIHLQTLYWLDNCRFQVDLLESPIGFVCIYAVAIIQEDSLISLIIIDTTHLSHKHAMSIVKIHKSEL